MYDPLVTLSIVAGETETLPIGTSVLLLPLRNPVMLAKRAVTLQRLSSRQLTLGLGAGYVQAEFDAVGVEMEERSARYLEGLELLRRLFDEREVTFHGEYYSVDNFKLEPHLGQPPRILVGGGGVDTENGRRVAQGVKERLRHAGGWIAPPRPPEVVKADWKEFADFLESNGTNPDSVDKVALRYLHAVPGDANASVRRIQKNRFRDLYTTTQTSNRAFENNLTGTIDEMQSEIIELERQGFDELILYPVTRTPDELDRQLHLYDEHFLSNY
jgi:alkanesulfonate monooxygenase